MIKKIQTLKAKTFIEQILLHNLIQTIQEHMTTTNSMEFEWIKRLVKQFQSLTSVGSNLAGLNFHYKFIALSIGAFNDTSLMCEYIIKTFYEVSKDRQNFFSVEKLYRFRLISKHTIYEE